MGNSQEYDRLYYSKKRKRLIDYLGGKCSICGSIDNLEIDHVDRANKSFGVRTKCSLDSIVDELNKCQLLCEKCHKEKTAHENSGFRHGTMYSWMRKKCDCEICKSAKRKWYDERNGERRLGNTRGMYNQPSPHGTIKTYHRGCKCDLCRRANADHVKELRKR